MPGGFECEGTHTGVRIDHARCQNACQFRKVDIDPGTWQVRAGDQRMHDGLPSTIRPQAIRIEELAPAGPVQQQLAQRPERRFPARLDRIVEVLDQCRHRGVDHRPAEAQQTVQAHSRVFPARGFLKQCRIALVTRSLSGSDFGEHLERRVIQTQLDVRSRLGIRGRMQPTQRPDRVRGRHEPCRGRGIPQTVGILIAKHPFDASLHDGIVRVAARGFQGDQRDRRGGGVAVVGRTLPSAVAIGFPGFEAPTAVLALEDEQPFHVGLRPLAEILVQCLGLGDPSRGVRQLANLLDIVRRPDAVKELDSMTVVVGHEDRVAGGQYLPGLLLHGEEVARLASVPPSPFQDLGGELEDHVRPEVRAAPGGVDAFRVGCLQHVVRRALLPLGVGLLRLESALVQDDVAASHARPGGAVPEIVGSHARVDRSVFQLVGQAERFVHRVDQPPVILLDSVRPVALAKRVRDAPYPALRVAAHAVLAEQRRRVAHSAVRSDIPRSVDQPRIDFSEVVVDSLAHGVHGIVIWSGIEEPYLHLVVRLIRLDAEVVRLAGLDRPSDESAERPVLLVGALVEGAAVFVGVDRHRSGHDGRRGMHVRNRIEVRKVVAVGDVSLAKFLLARHAFLVEADSRARHGFDDLQVRADVLRLATLVFDPVPIVRGHADAGVVVVLEIVRSADHVDDLDSRALRERNLRRLLRSVVRLGLQNQRSMR